MIQTVNMQNPLAESALLANVAIKQWTGRKLDRDVTDAANTAHHAKPDAGRFNKQLLPSEAFAKITRAVSAAKAFHYARTLPWTDKGARILSVAGYVEYMAGMADIKRDFDSAVAEFVTAYPGYVATAPQRLGQMFDASEFPDVSQIAARYAMEFVLSNIPDVADFRVDLPAGQAEAIKADMEARARDALSGAVRDVFERVANAVGHMANKLAEYKPATKKGERAQGNFHASLVTNVQELAALLPSLNVTGDAKLAELADKMKALCQIDANTPLDAATLKESDNVRAKIAADAARLVADVESHMSAYFA